MRSSVTPILKNMVERPIRAIKPTRDIFSNVRMAGSTRGRASKMMRSLSEAGMTVMLDFSEAEEVEVLFTEFLSWLEKYEGE
jgi:hypothetical protein